MRALQADVLVWRFWSSGYACWSTVVSLSTGGDVIHLRHLVQRFCKLADKTPAEPDATHAPIPRVMAHTGNRFHINDF